MSPDTLSLAGKVAIITGSGRENGIGAAIAKALARNGAAVTINYVTSSSAPRATAVAKHIEEDGGRATVVKASVDNGEDAQRLVSETLSAFGTDHIDILVNNAGAVAHHPTVGMSRDSIESIFNVNVFGTIFLTQAILPHMPPGGRIINISSVASKLGMDVAPFYGASKAAVDSLSYAWAKEFGRSKGITVNTIAPGPVHTDMGPAEDKEEEYEELLGLTRAAKRVGRVEDIADAVLLVANERARWVTGQYISVSGGVTGN